MGDPRFKAVIEAWSAAGNDPELATEIAPAIGRFAKLMSVDDQPPASGRSRNADVATFVLMAREAMLGHAFGRAVAGGKPLAHEARVLQRLRSDAAEIDASRLAPRASP